MSTTIIFDLSKSRIKSLKDYVRINNIKNHFGRPISINQACYSIVAEFCDQCKEELENE